MRPLRVADFDFHLPPELIAQQPPAERGLSRMLAMNRATGALRDSSFAELPTLLNPGDLLVLNESRVIPARLYAHRTRNLGAPGPASGTRETAQPTGKIEVFLTEPVAPQMLGVSDQKMLGAPSIPRSSAEWVGTPAALQAGG